jgi:small subunit ribosomal protein S20
VASTKLGNKAARAASRKRLRNRLIRRSLKTYVVKARTAADAGDESAYQRTMIAVSSLDRAASKGVIHKNKAARLKSTLISNLNKERGATG